MISSYLDLIGAGLKHFGPAPDHPIHDYDFGILDIFNSFLLQIELLLLALKAHRNELLESSIILYELVRHKGLSDIYDSILVDYLLNFVFLYILQV